MSYLLTVHLHSPTFLLRLAGFLHTALHPEPGSHHVLLFIYCGCPAQHGSTPMHTALTTQRLSCRCHAARCSKYLSVNDPGRAGTTGGVTSDVIPVYPVTRLSFTTRPTSPVGFGRSFGSTGPEGGPWFFLVFKELLWFCTNTNTDTGAIVLKLDMAMPIAILLHFNT